MCGVQAGRRLGAAGRAVLLGALVLGLLAGASGLTSVPAGAAGIPLRQVDWHAVLASDPAITIDPTAYPLPGQSGPYIVVQAQRLRGPDELSGYVLLDQIEYGDLDGDGAEEAVIVVHSGGTAGAPGFLLYREGVPAPKLVLAETGYKLGVQIVGGDLVIAQPHYVGFEPNCCPSAIVTTTAALSGDRLAPFATEVTPNDVQELTVSAFYEALADRRYDEAYAFYSPALQAQNPFDRWKAGYAATQAIQVETAPGAAPNEVLIQLTATDARPGGGTATRRFRGAWTLVWSADQKRWLLDTARIEPVS